MRPLLEEIANLELAFDIPLNLYSPRGKRTYISQKTSFSESIEPPINQVKRKKSPLLIQGDYGENYIFIRLKQTLLFVGPLLFSPQESDAVLKKLQKRMNRSVEKKYYSTISIYPVPRVQAIMQVMAKTLNFTLPKSWPLLDKETERNKREDADILELPQRTHSSHLKESQFYEAVRDGQDQEVLFRLQEFYNSGTLGTLSSDGLRNEKNLAISSITLMTRSAIDGGVEPTIAYDVSDKYIRRIEGLYTIETVDQLIIQAVLEFTEKVKHVRLYDQYSPTISKALRILHDNYRLSIGDTAAAIGVSANYLSRIFKKEVGESFSKYKQKHLLEKAVELMKHTNRSISDIALELGFYDTSHFSRTFKSVFNTSPRAMREGHFRYLVEEDSRKV